MTDCSPPSAANGRRRAIWREKVVDAIAEKLGGNVCRLHHRDRATARRAGSARFADFVRSASRARSENIRNIDHLARLYGARLPKVLECAGNKPGMRAQLVAHRRYRRADALRHRRRNGDDAGRCRDAPHRHRPAWRSGRSGTSTKRSWLMASELEWNAARKQRELDALAANFRTQPRAVSAQ